MRSYQGIDISVYRDTAERANMLRIHTFLQDASRALSANVVVTSSAVGAAPSNAAYLTIGNDASLSAERAIVTTSPLTATDGGANSSWTLGFTASAVDHGSLSGLADDDHTQYILSSGTRPLTNAWDAGNFAITLGSIVGKSGNLSIAPASGGNIAFSTSIASGAFNSGFTFTDTIARTAGQYFAITDSAGAIIGSWNATVAFFKLVIPTAATAHTSILQFAGTTTGLGSCHGIDVALTNTGNSTGSSRFDVLQGTVAVSGTATLSGSRQIRGVRTAASVTGGNFGTRANDTISGATIGVGFFNTTFTWPDVSYLVLHHNNTSPTAITRFTGLAIARPPVTPTSAVAIHAQGNVQMEAGDLLVFDGTATIVNSINSGTAATPDGRITAQTLGDTYFTYSVANTQLDCFVDAAQAFHFDASGAGGTSRCYGALTISAGATITAGGLTVTAGNAVVTAGNLTVTAGTGQFGGLLTADVGMTATTGDITATAGNITTVAGDIISGSDLALAGGSWLKFDGTTNNAMILSGGNLSLFLGGSQEYIFTTSSFLLASGNTIAIDTNKLILAEAQFTHAPTSAAIFTMSMKDAVLLTTTQTATTRTMFDVLWGVAASTGVRALAAIRDNTNTYFNIESQRGITELSKYANSGEWLARGMGDLAGDEWVWDFNTDAGAVFTTGGLVRYRFNGSTAATMTELGYLDCSSDVRASQLVADGDTGGVASTVTFTKTNTAVSGVTPAVLATTGGGPAGATQSHWLKIYDGTTARYIPVWT